MEKFKISASTWNDTFKLPDESSFVSDIQDYFDHIKKNIMKKIDNPSIKIYVNTIENIITFKTKTGYYLEL